jgi:single-stranded-DNA-specific exonuclease
VKRLLHAKTRWQSATCPQDSIDRLVDHLHIDPLIARLLVVRGLTEPDQAQRFLFGSTADFHDPFAMHDMDVAVERVHEAIRNQEKIRIYGDYDADGVSSTTLMSYLMRSLGANFDYYIPNRFNEGYGLNIAALDKAKSEGVRLVITVDTGISAVEQAQHAREIGLDLIITDHHEPPELLPDAYAVINPKKPGCSYPFDMLAGVGVAFKVAHALLGRLPEEWFEIAALGTIADLVPLVDENRLIVKYGLEQMGRTALPGMKALIQMSGVKDSVVGVGHVGFGMAPRINAGGRLDTADDAVKLLTTYDEQEAEQLAYALDQMNKERQRLVEEMTKEAVEMWEELRTPAQDHFIVLAKEDWNVGVVGIVASKLVEKYYRPVIILGIDPAKGIAKGSARSIDGFDLYGALTECHELLQHYGGHKAAAGMTLEIKNVDAFRRRLNELASERLSEEDKIPLTKVDAECELQQIDMPLLEQIEKMAPFGMGNPSPKWLIKGSILGEARTLGKGNSHLKMQLIGDKRVDAIGFHIGKLAHHLTLHSQPRIVGELQVNEWNGIRRPQVLVHDISVPHSQIFDWRCPAQESSDWLNHWRDTEPGEQMKRQTALILYHKKAWDGLSQMFAPSFEYSNVWHVNLVGGLELLQGVESSVDSSDVRNLIMLDVPERLTQWETGLSYFPQIERIYCCYEKPESTPIPMVPEREQFGKVYRLLNTIGRVPGEKELEKLSYKAGLSVAMVQFMIEVFLELGFVVREGNTLKVALSPAKRELDQSTLFIGKQEKVEIDKAFIFSSTKQLTEFIQQTLKGK